jgi:hypothetical protein
MTITSKMVNALIVDEPLKGVGVGAFVVDRVGVEVLGLDVVEVPVGELVVNDDVAVGVDVDVGVAAGVVGAGVVGFVLSLE